MQLYSGNKAKIIYGKVISHYIAENKVKPNFFDLNVEDIVRDFEGRINTFRFDKEKVKENPVIVDIGCGDFPHYFAMFDYFDKFTYIGVDKNFYKETKEIADHIRKEDPNFHLLEMSILSNELPQIVKQISKNKADVVLIEHLAVGDADNQATDDLLKKVLHEMVPVILSEQGVLHIEAASSRQIGIIRKILNEGPGTTFNVTEDNGNFMCTRKHAPAVILK